MEKIKLEWGTWGSNTFTFKGIHNLKFGVYETLMEVHLYSHYQNSERELTLGFPQETRITSTEQGRKFCQDWLDALVEKENRKDRVQKVLEDILNGKTELVWITNQPWESAFPLLDGKKNEIVAFRNRIRIYNYEKYKSFPDNQETSSIEEGKKIIQDWYNKYLLEQASK